MTHMSRNREDLNYASAIEIASVVQLLRTQTGKKVKNPDNEYFHSVVLRNSEGLERFKFPPKPQNLYLRVTRYPKIDQGNNNNSSNDEENIMEWWSIQPIESDGKNNIEGSQIATMNRFLISYCVRNKLPCGSVCTLTLERGDIRSNWTKTTLTPVANKKGCITVTRHYPPFYSSMLSEALGTSPRESNKLTTIPRIGPLTIRNYMHLSDGGERILQTGSTEGKRALVVSIINLCEKLGRNISMRTNTKECSINVMEYYKQRSD
eukprot:Tbor_TRINITY_DN2162_c0_g1::TRINITY_DN2162_c0_g1_i1::g.5466::m.5466